MKKQFHLTKEGITELENELEKLKSQRGAIAERIKTAREFGDLTENAEYSAARQEQEKTENRIAELEHILQHVEVIKKPNGNKKQVQLGSTVTVKANSKKKQFQIVGTVEANPLEGKISDESPIGKALYGKKVGEKIEIGQGGETVTYALESIE